MDVGYNERLASLSTKVPGLEWLPSALSKKFAGRTRAYYFNGKASYFNSPEPVIQQALLDAGQNGQKETLAVCIVENASPRWIKTLGEAWDLSPEFFLEHARNPPKESVWDSVFNRNRDPMQSPSFVDSSQSHITGVHGYHNWTLREGKQLDSSPNFFRRHCWDGPRPYPVSSNTRISYCRVTSALCMPFLPAFIPRVKLIKSVIDLFLVDAPIDLTRSCVSTGSRARPTLRLPCSLSRGGLMLPSLYESPTSGVFESFVSFLTHTWHFHIFYSSQFTKTEVLPCAALLYMLSASIWTSNLRFLNREIKRISFNELRQPNVQINSLLHDCREDLEWLRDYTTETRKYIPDTVVEWHSNAFSAMPYHKITPVEVLDGIIEDIASVSSFLMDSFQLLMSTISTLDSQTSLEQARRGTRLTQLAFIYLPLSLVTSIFGMNLREINGSPLRVWVVFVSLLVVMTCTAAVFWILEQRHTARTAITRFVPPRSKIRLRFSRKSTSGCQVNDEVFNLERGNDPDG